MGGVEIKFSLCSPSVFFNFMKIKIKYNHKQFSIILFSVSVLAMTPVLIDDFLAGDFFLFSSLNIIYIAVISYLFYRNGIKSSKLCPEFKRDAFAVIFLLALFVNFWAMISNFSFKDQSLPLLILIYNIFFIPILIISSLIIFIISFLLGNKSSEKNIDSAPKGFFARTKMKGNCIIILYLIYRIILGLNLFSSKTILNNFIGEVSFIYIPLVFLCELRIFYLIVCCVFWVYGKAMG